MEPILDLYNFDNPNAEGSRYVLTSPRSLEACSRLHIKPVQLLPKTVSDFAEENAGKSSNFIQILFNDWEENRINKLTRCRKEREKIVMENQVSRSKKKHDSDKKRRIPVSNDTKRVTRNILSNENDGSKKLSIVPQPSDKSPRQATKKRLGPDMHQNANVVNNMDMKNVSSPVITTESPSRKNTPIADGYISPALPMKIDEHLINVMTPRSDRSRTLKVRSNNRSRSRSVETQNRSGQSMFVSCSLRTSALGFSSQLPSGYVTPQIQRDKRLVEFMKEKRRREELEEKVRREKMLEWNEEKKKSETLKRQEAILRQKEVAAAHARWEKTLNVEIGKRRLEIARLEEERILEQEQAEAIVKSNKEKQERLRLQHLEERKKAAAERKQQQERILHSVHKEVEAFQEATETDIKGRLERAERTKLENEMRELEKVKVMNKKQWERFREVQKSVIQKRKEEARLKKEMLEEKLSKAEENHKRTIMMRNSELKTQCHEKNEKIRQTKENHKRIDKEVEEHKHAIAEHKNELLRHAETTALQATQNKSKRAQQMRIASEATWKKNKMQIQEKDEEHTLRTMEDLEAKENKTKKHLQLKEAALEFSRVQAKINEAEREIVKRKTANFSQMAQQAKLMANVGRGPRSSFVNYSTVKLG